MKRATVVTGAIGILFFALAGYLLLQERLFLQRAESTTATVTDNQLRTYVDSNNQGGSPYYCSEFQFQTKDGQTVSFEENGCGALNAPPDYQVGQKVEIYYDPADPKGTVQLHKFSDQYYGPASAIIAGSLALILALVLFWRDRLRSR